MLCLCGARVAYAGDDAARLVTLQQLLTACVAQLPSDLHHAFVDTSARRTIRIAPRLRKQWSACVARERDLTDQRAIFNMRDDLLALIHNAAAIDAATRAEAEAIATRIVQTTRTVGEEYGMVGSPLFNNFLVHVGIKKAGFCYHWTETLARAVADLPWQHFSHLWGVASLLNVTENNALVIMSRGESVADGIVYDPWRGAGKPYWRSVAGDHYKWTTRYTERNLAMGVGLDEISPPHPDSANTSDLRRRANDAP